jgi:hypothetical protein
MSQSSKVRQVGWVDRQRLRRESHRRSRNCALWFSHGTRWSSFPQSHVYKPRNHTWRNGNPSCGQGVQVERCECPAAYRLIGSRCAFSNPATSDPDRPGQTVPFRCVCALHTAALNASNTWLRKAPPHTTRMSHLLHSRFSFTHYNATPLHYACRYGHGHLVDRLLELGENPNSLDRVCHRVLWGILRCTLPSNRAVLTS